MKTRNWFTAALLTLVMLFALAVPAGAAKTEPQPADAVGHTVILHTNDVHGALDGYAQVAAVKKAYEAAGASVLLVDAGGFLQGSPVLTASKGKAAVELMNLAGYDAAVPGCQALSYGQDILNQRIDQADFPILTANILKDTQPLQPTSKTFTLPNGVTVGMFGLVHPDTANNCPEQGAKDLTVLADQDLIDCAQAQADALNAKGCDIVIALGHLGKQSRSLLEKLSGVDVFIDGHDHETLQDIAAETNKDCIINNILLTSAGTGMEQLGVLEIDPKGNLQTANVPMAQLKESFPPDAAIQAQADAFKKEFSTDPSTPHGISELALDSDKVRTQETSLSDLLCDAMLWQGKKDDKTPDLALLDAGSIGASLPAGPITDAVLNAVIPKDQPLVLATVSGTALREALEAASRLAPQPSASFPQVAGMSLTFNTGVPFVGTAKYPGTSELKPSAIHRTLIQYINQGSFDPKAAYTIVTTEAIAKGTGAYGAFRGAKFQPLNTTLRQTTSEFIRSYLSGTVTESMYGFSHNLIHQISYRDVYAGDWYASAVNYVTLTGFMQGSEGDFHPNQTLNRAMMVTVLYRMREEPAVSGPNPFHDVPNNTWYTKPVLWTSQNHITSGITNTSFAPLHSLTREQLATFLYRFAQYESDEPIAPEGNHLKGFRDARSISSYAREAMNWAVAEGILSGTSPNYLSPQHSATRAQVAMILMRYTTGW